MTPGRLISFGCSHVAGDGLTSQEQVYSSVLSKMLDLKHVNCGESGASNKLIMYNVLNFDFQNNDTAIILWSHTERTTFFNKDGVHLLLNPSSEKNKIQAKKYYKLFHNEYHHDVESTHAIHYTNLYLKSKNIKIYNILQNPIVSYSNINFEDIQVLDVFFGVFRHLYPLANDQSHMGFLGHNKLAEKVFELIENKNYMPAEKWCNG